MMINTKTIVTFILPNECQRAVEFEKSNPEWVKREDTRAVCFSYESMYNVEGGSDGTNKHATTA